MIAGPFAPLAGRARPLLALVAPLALVLARRGGRAASCARPGCGWPRSCSTRLARRRRARSSVTREAPVAVRRRARRRGALPLAPSRPAARSRSRCASGCPIRSAAPRHRRARCMVPPGEGLDERLELMPPSGAAPARAARIAVRILGPLGLAWRQETARAALDGHGVSRACPTPSLRALPLQVAPPARGRAPERSAGRAKAGCSRGSASGCRATRPASSTGRRPPAAASRSRGSTRTSGGSRC